MFRASRCTPGRGPSCRWCDLYSLWESDRWSCDWRWIWVENILKRQSNEWSFSCWFLWESTPWQFWSLNHHWSKHFSDCLWTGWTGHLSEPPKRSKFRESSDQCIQRDQWHVRQDQSAKDDRGTSSVSVQAGARRKESEGKEFQCNRLSMSLHCLSSRECPQIFQGDLCCVSCPEEGDREMFQDHHQVTVNWDNSRAIHIRRLHG